MIDPNYGGTMTLFKPIDEKTTSVKIKTPTAISTAPASCSCRIAHTGDWLLHFPMR